MSIAPEGERYVYEGRAGDFFRRVNARDPEPQELMLEHAILDAYDKATAGRDGPFQFRVVALIIEGTNPPSDYKAQLVDHP